jgi:hypothetical protein
MFIHCKCNICPSLTGRVDPYGPVTSYIDSFGNRCIRFLAPKGTVGLYNSKLIEDSGCPDPSELARPRNSRERLWV